MGSALAASAGVVLGSGRFAGKTLGELNFEELSVLQSSTSRKQEMRIGRDYARAKLALEELGLAPLVGEAPARMVVDRRAVNDLPHDPAPCQLAPMNRASREAATASTQCSGFLTVDVGIQKVWVFLISQKWLILAWIAVLLAAYPPAAAIPAVVLGTVVSMILGRWMEATTIFSSTLQGYMGAVAPEVWQYIDSYFVWLALDSALASIPASFQVAGAADYSMGKALSYITFGALLSLRAKRWITWP